MSVIMADRRLAKRTRIVGTDTHGDKVAAGYDPPTAAYPGVANIGADTPEYQPGGRTWTLAVDPQLWPVSQQDLIVDVDTGEEWEVQSAKLNQHTIMPLVTYVHVDAHSYTSTEGTKA